MILVTCVGCWSVDWKFRCGVFFPLAFSFCDLREFETDCYLCNHIELDPLCSFVLYNMWIRVLIWYLLIIELQLQCLSWWWTIGFSVPLFGFGIWGFDLCLLQFRSFLALSPFTSLCLFLFFIIFLMVYQSLSFFPSCFSTVVEFDLLC